MPRLTPEQRAIRLTGVGASESAAISELDPYKGAVDIWLRKPVGGLPPLVVEEDQEESEQAEIGHLLEGPLADYYTMKTGIEVNREKVTLRHPEIPCVLASPDGLAVSEDSGLEIKVVGWRMAHHWEGDCLPDYVTTQVVQNMAVAGRSRWDVLALIGGTRPAIYSIERDLDLEETLLASVQKFWIDCVLGGEMPEVSDIAERRRYLRARYPGSAKTACRPVADVDGTIAEAIERRQAALARIGELEGYADGITAWLCEQVADGYGIQGPFGKFIWNKVNGQVNWQAVAEEVAGGAIPAGLIEKHRRASFRTPRYYPPPQPKKRLAGTIGRRLGL